MFAYRACPYNNNYALRTVERDNKTSYASFILFGIKRGRKKRNPADGTELSKINLSNRRFGESAENRLKTARIGHAERFVFWKVFT